MLDLKRRAAMPGGCAETEVPRTVAHMIGDLESRFEPLLRHKQQRMAEILSGNTDTDTDTARARAEELRRLAKDVLGMAPVFGYHAVGDMATTLADTVDRLDFADPQVQSFCRWQVDALSIVIRRKLRGTKPQDVADTLRDTRHALDTLARRNSGPG